MSINTSIVPEIGGIILYNGERILVFYDGCELRLKSKDNNPFMSGTKKGKIFLTSHRVVYMSKEKNDRLKSLSMPFSNMKNVDIKQPVFGANKIEGIIHAEPDGGFQGSAEFSFTFNHGGAIEFGTALLELGKRASQNRGMPPPPPYNYQNCIAYPTQGGMPMGAQSYYSAPPPAYAPPYQDPYYNFVPQHQSFVSPPSNMVYMYPTPPPYPGAYNPPPYPSAAANNTPYPPANGAGAYAGACQPPPYQPAHNAYGSEQMTPSERAKAAEANQSAYSNGYYDPNNPHMVYSPPPPAYNSIQHQSAPVAGIDDKPPPYNPDYKKCD